MTRRPNTAATRTVRGRELAPLDAVADRVTRPGPAFAYEYDESKNAAALGRTPPRFQPVPKSIEDLRGSKRGRLTIVGYLGAVPDSGGGLKHNWVARCVCGRYERREGYKWRYLRARGKNDDVCGACRHTDQLRNRARRLSERDLTINPEALGASNYPSVGGSRRTTTERPHVEKEHILQFFQFEHLPPHLREVSEPFGVLAAHMVASLPRNPERTVALRKLLESKDAAVRAKLAESTDAAGAAE